MSMNLTNMQQKLVFKWLIHIDPWRKIGFCYIVCVCHFIPLVPTKYPPPPLVTMTTNTATIFDDHDDGFIND